jgi:hypothetical protein
VEISDSFEELKPDRRTPTKEKKKDNRKIGPKKPRIALVQRASSSLSSSESEDESLHISKIKPVKAPTMKSSPVCSEVAPVVLASPVSNNTSPPTTSPSIIPNHIIVTARAASSLKPQIQSILELQQMHHRQALAQQQLNFMLVLQQQHQVESDNAFRNLMQIMQQHD